MCGGENASAVNVRILKLKYYRGRLPFGTFFEAHTNSIIIVSVCDKLSSNFSQIATYVTCFLSGNRAYMHGTVIPLSRQCTVKNLVYYVGTAFECYINKPFFFVAEQLQTVLGSKDEKSFLQLLNVSIFKKEVIAFRHSKEFFGILKSLVFGIGQILSVVVNIADTSFEVQTCRHFACVFSTVNWNIVW